MGHVSAPATRLQVASSTYATSGLSVIPIGSLKNKSPRLETWAPYTVAAAGEAEAVAWFTPNGHPAAPGLGIVCGAVSGGLTVIDFDTMADGDTAFDTWAALVEQLAPGLVDRLPSVITPSGGRHVYFRCDVVEGNAKLAMSSRNQTWIETRGEGGYVLAPPTEGYYAVHGRLSQTPTITMAERSLLLHAARSLSAKAPAPPRLPDDTSPLPGDAYNAKATIASVSELMIKHGWTLVAQDAAGASLRRPGKAHGISATVRLCGGTPITYCFSSNAAPLPSCEGLSPFAVYTHLTHAGDYSQAARALGGPAVGKQAQPAPAQPAQSGAEPYEWENWLFSGQSLLDTEFAPVSFVVDGVIPPGLTLIAGSPKSGKSLMGWNIALAVVTGGVALGAVPVQRRPVLYLMLEDGKRLVQKRMRRMLAPGVSIPGLQCGQAWRKLTEGGTQAIGEYCARNPDALVIIDTYESLRGNGEAAHDSYRNDYAALKPLADLVHEHDLNVLIIHHTNKRGGDDPFMSINGSNGISGTPDTIGVLRRTNQKNRAILHLRGRELDSDLSLALEYDPETGCQTLLGDAEEEGKNDDQRRIIDFLRGLGLQSSPIEIARGVGREDNSALRMQLSRMVEAGALVKTDWGRYFLPGDGPTVTGVTHPQQSADPDCEPIQFPVRGCVTPVTPVTTAAPEPDAAPDDDSASGVDDALQAQPCPGCGKRWTKRVSPSGQGAPACLHCGTECAIT
jgi:hypothetical protein